MQIGVDAGGELCKTFCPWLTAIDLLLFFFNLTLLPSTAYCSTEKVSETCTCYLSCCVNIERLKSNLRVSYFTDILTFMDHLWLHQETITVECFQFYWAFWSNFADLNKHLRAIPDCMSWILDHFFKKQHFFFNSLSRKFASLYDGETLYA